MDQRKYSGTRIKLAKGMDEESHNEHMMWCAGTIPVGQKGTIQWSEGKMMLHIVWDNYLAKEGYIYGIIDIDNVDGLLEFI